MWKWKKFSTLSYTLREARISQVSVVSSPSFLNMHTSWARGSQTLKLPKNPQKASLKCCPSSTRKSQVERGWAIVTPVVLRPPLKELLWALPRSTFAGLPTPCFQSFSGGRPFLEIQAWWLLLLEGRPDLWMYRIALKTSHLLPDSPILGNTQNIFDTQLLNQILIYIHI